MLSAINKAQINKQKKMKKHLKKDVRQINIA